MNRRIRSSQQGGKILRRLQQDDRVEQMKQFMQHGKVTTFDHCIHVAKISRWLDHRLHLHSNQHVLLSGAMLHDFFLYDWHHDDNGTHRWHGFSHADTAARNVRTFFGKDPRVEHVIRSHMWPLNLTHLPRSREAWIVCVADKLAAIQETLFRR